jgi:4-hydroxy-3-methylbut-2-enyl diphosphate reductase IspH
MKTKLSFLLLFFALFSMRGAEITVSNDPLILADYADLQEAHDAAADNDTIIIYASPYMYETLDISKPLTIMGAGNSLLTRIGTRIETVNFHTGGSGSTITGCSIMFVSFYDGDFSDITLVNNSLFVLNSDSRTLNNSLVHNNVIFQFNGMGFTNSVVSNNLIFLADFSIVPCDNLEVSHNNFGYLYYGVGMTIRNNAIQLQIGGIFNESYVIENNMLPLGYNYELTYDSSNIFASNFGFTVGFPDSSYYTYYAAAEYVESYIGSVSEPYPNLNLLETSPGKNAGTDGTDIGLYGGEHPFVEGDVSGSGIYRYYPSPEEYAAAQGTPLPVAADQLVCTGAHVSDLVAVGTNLKWYTVAVDGTPLAATKKVVPGTYYVTQTVSSESERVAVVVTMDHCSTIIAPLCGSTLNKINSSIVAKTVPGATQYRFRISDGDAIVTVDKETESFNIAETSISRYDQSYSIDVATMVDDDWSGYGALCTLTTPAAAPAILESLCGTEVSVNTILYAEKVTGATLYRFRITNGANVQTLDRTTYTAKLSMFADFDYNTTYTIDVAVKAYGVLTPYGPACNITLPAVTTNIKESLCGTDITTATQIYANTVLGATQYRFRITSGATVQTIDRSVNNMKLNMLAQYNYNTTYTIDVAVEVDGAWTAYGTACNLTVPPVTTKLRESLCGTNVSATTQLYATIVPGATQYRFRLTSGATVQTIDRTVNNMKLNMLAQYDYGTTYTVDIAVEANGIWMPYGTACTITLPFPTTRLKETLCGTTVFPTTQLYANTVPGATQYRFRLTSGANVQTIDRPTSTMKLNMLADYSYSSYTIDVAVEVNGTWAPYGSACTVNAPSMLTRLAQDTEEATQDMATSVNVVAYPNPYSDVFTLEMTGGSIEEVNVMVFDITGKQLDNLTIAHDNLQSVKIGDRYSAGIYNIIVTQGTYQKMLKIVKK